MLQRLGKARSARAADQVRTAGLDGAEAPAEGAARTGLSEVNGTSLAGEPDRPAGARPSREGGRQQGGPPGEGGRPGAAGRPRDTGRAREAAGAPAPAARATRTVELPADFDLAAHDPLRAFLM